MAEFPKGKLFKSSSRQSSQHSNEEEIKSVNKGQKGKRRNSLFDHTLPDALKHYICHKCKTEIKRGKKVTKT